MLAADHITVGERPQFARDHPADADDGQPLLREIRKHWPNTRITIRGDSHYGRSEVMDWCEAKGIRYVFGLSGNDVLRSVVEPATDDVRVRRAEADAPLLRRYTETE